MVGGHISVSQRFGVVSKHLTDSPGRWNRLVPCALQQATVLEPYDYDESRAAEAELLEREMVAMTSALGDFAALVSTQTDQLDRIEDHMSGVADTVDDAAVQLLDAESKRSRRWPATAALAGGAVGAVGGLLLALGAAPLLPPSLVGAAGAVAGGAAAGAVATRLKRNTNIRIERDRRDVLLRKVRNYSYCLGSFASIEALVLCQSYRWRDLTTFLGAVPAVVWCGSRLLETAIRRLGSPKSMLPEACHFLT